MPIERRSITKLKPYRANPRTHPQGQIDKLALLIQKYGFHDSHAVAIDEDGVVIWGHGRIEAARQAGLKEVPVEVLTGLSETDKQALRIADNGIAEQSDWDLELLAKELESLNQDGYSLELLALDDSLLEELGGVFDPGEMGGDEDWQGGLGGELKGDPDEVPEGDQIVSRCQRGDVWRLGRHRLMCGDSTDRGDVEKLMAGERAALLHADPPYGMGKEKDGVQNDNLYRDKLCAFQMAWWGAVRPSLEDNASAYIWGNAEELWRLWYSGGLRDSERLTFRSQVIWNKPPSAGPCGSPIGSEKMRSYPHGYEVVLYFMLGEQGFNNNADNYWEGWEPIRVYLAGERAAMGWDVPTMKKLVGHSDLSRDHWTSKSQWNFVTEDVYKALQSAAKGDAFKRDYEELKRDYEELKRDYEELKRDYEELKREFYSTRAYFDNTHDNMTDVWEFPRVTGEERHGHATPKPVAMMERIMKSSLPKGGLCVEPFGGSGSTLIAAEKTGRDCRIMELDPHYCDVIIQRWETLTGGTAVNAQT